MASPTLPYRWLRLPSQALERWIGAPRLAVQGQVPTRPRQVLCRHGQIPIIRQGLLSDMLSLKSAVSSATALTQSRMSLIPNPVSVDFSAFDASDDDARVMYGLPRYLHFCKKCVISNQRPNSAVEYQHTKASKKATINV
jgi:hypothetical protein